MAAISSNGTGGGNWSSTATWAGGVLPVSGDSVTIVLGDTVTFDVDQSGFAAGLAALTINGTLQSSTTAGSYVLKMDGTGGHDISFGASGQLLAGSSGTPLPTATVFTINLNGASKINNANGLVALFCTQPTYLAAVLSAQANAAATTLSYTQAVRASDFAVVSADLTTDTYWGAIASQGVQVDNINKAADSEARVLSAIGSTSLTITAGLTNTKLAGSYVWLTWRNIRIIGGTSSSGAIFTGSSAVLQCEISNGASGLACSNTVNSTLSGIVHGPNTACTNCSSTLISGVVTGLTTCFNAGEGSLVSGFVSGVTTVFQTHAGGKLTGTITGCTTGMAASIVEVSGSIINSTTGIQQGTAFLRGATLSNNNQDITVSSTLGWPYVNGFGASLNSATQVAGYSGALPQAGWQRIVIWDVGGVNGGLKAWMYGGRVINDTGTLPPAPTIFTQTYNHIFERNNTPVYLDINFFAQKNVPFTITVSLKKDTNTMTETPSAAIIDPGKEIFSTASRLVTSTMVDNTSWQTLTLTYTADHDRALILRLRGRNASGNLWWNATIVRAPGLRAVPLFGGIMQ